MSLWAVEVTGTVHAGYPVSYAISYAARFLLVIYLGRCGMYLEIGMVDGIYLPLPR